MTNMSIREYKLLPNESIIMKQDRIMTGGKLSNFTDELILTNLNIVIISKGVFGNFKSMEIVPLSRIKIFGDKAQILLSKTGTGFSQIEIYHQKGSEKFGFQSKRIARHWMEIIGKVVNDEHVEIGSVPEPEIPGFGVVADTLGATFGKLKETFGLKDNQKQEETSESFTNKCKFCGAPLRSKIGINRCEYCDSEQ